MPRFILRLMLLLGLPCALLIVMGIAIGQTQPDQEWEILVFQHDVWNRAKLYLMDTNHKIIAHVSGYDFNYMDGWLPTKRQLIHRRLPLQGSPVPDVYSFDLTTGRSTLLIFPDRFEQARFPVWSPDGQRVAISDWHDIYLMVDGQAHNLTQRPEEGESLSSPIVNWSPDSLSIAYNTRRDLYVVDVISQQVRNLTNRPPDADTISDTFGWSPDSKKIAYIVGTEFEPNNLFVVHIDNGRIEQPTNTANFQFWGPFWSADGKLILARNRAYALLMVDLQHHSTELISRLNFQRVNPSSDGWGLVIYDEVQRQFIYFDLLTRSAHPLFDYPLPDWTKLSNFEFMPK